MIPEIGNFALVLALFVVLARVQAIIVERERGAGWLESLIQFPAGGSA